MKTRLGAAFAVLLAATLAGCATPSTPFDDAYAACIALYDEVKPDGFANAENGEHIDSERACDGAVAAQGRDKFTELFNDPAFIERYAEGIAG